MFVSGRNTVRNGFVFKSREPYSTDGFDRLSPSGGESFTYPQIWHLPGTANAGDELFFHFFTRYTGGRELYFGASANPAQTTASAVKLAAMQGHYQCSAHFGNKVATSFNRHPGGNVDARTDLYYMESSDFGATWTTADGTVLTLPQSSAAAPSRVIDYSSQGLLVYPMDLSFDSDGNPVMFYITTRDFRPGPNGEPRLARVTRWTGSEWVTSSIPASATATSTVIHNYSVGGLDARGPIWRAVLPSGSAGPAPASGASTDEIHRYWGHGGEMEAWVSSDQGLTWVKESTITQSSLRKHGYARLAQDAADPFFVFWADGNPEAFTEVHLHFASSDGRVWELPYNFESEDLAAIASPILTKVMRAYGDWRESIDLGQHSGHGAEPVLEPRRRCLPQPPGDGARQVTDLRGGR